MRKNSDHDLTIATKYGTLLVDDQPRGGLLLQIGVSRDGDDEWNFLRLPKRLAHQLRKFLDKREDNNG